MLQQYQLKYRLCENAIFFNAFPGLVQSEVLDPFSGGLPRRYKCNKSAACIASHWRQVKPKTLETRVTGYQLKPGRQAGYTYTVTSGN
jgi:hypothetical protein